MAVKLRAVDKNERPKKPVKRIESVSDAIAEGSRLDELSQMRRVIAKAIDTTSSARDLAALTKRLTELSKEIDAERRLVDEEADNESVSEDEEWDADAI